MWYVLVTQSCPTLCNPMDCTLPGSSILGILQARILEWVAIPFSRGSSRPGINPGSPALQADSLPSKRPGKPRAKQSSPIYRLVDWGTSSNFAPNYTPFWADLHSHNSSWTKLFYFLKVTLKVKSASCSVVSNSFWLHGLIQSMEFSKSEYWSG